MGYFECKLDVSGFKELDALMKLMPIAVQEDIAFPALMAGAAPIAEDCKGYARSNFANPTGKLAESIRVEPERKHGIFTSVAVVFGGKWFTGKTFYGAFWEFGFHLGKRKGGRRQGTKYVIGNDAREEIPARPMLRPAFDQNVERSAGIIGKWLAFGINKAWRSMGKAA